MLRRGTNDDARLREVLNREFSADDVALFASGTHALQVALADARRGVGWVPAPTVALPAFTCFDVATAAVGAGLRIALYDIDPETLAPDLESLSGALAEGAQIVVVAPLFGFPVDWEGVRATAAPHGARIIEDAAQGSGATWHGTRLGSLGETSVLSFGRGKGWTGGCGGALLTRRRGAPRAVRNGRRLGAELRALTLASAQWAFGRPALYGIPAAVPWLGLGETRYRDPTPPRPLPRTAARLLLHDVAASRQEGEERRRRAERLLATLERSARVRPIRPLPGAVPGYLRLPLRVAGGGGLGGLAGLAQRDVARRLGVSRSYPHCLGDLPAVRERLVDSSRTWPGAEALARELITLPTHSLLSERDMEQLARVVGWLD